MFYARIFRTWYLVLGTLFFCLLLSCRSVDSCFEMPSHTYTDGEFTLAKWGGYSWCLLPSEGDAMRYRYEFMLLDAEDRDLPCVLEKLTAELGQPVASNSVPVLALARVSSNTAIFGFAGGRPLADGEELHWWITDTHVARLYLCPHKEMPVTPPFALLSLYSRSALAK